MADIVRSTGDFVSYTYCNLVIDGDDIGVLDGLCEFHLSEDVKFDTTHQMGVTRVRATSAGRNAWFICHARQWTKLVYAALFHDVDYNDGTATLRIEPAMGKEISGQVVYLDLPELLKRINFPDAAIIATCDDQFGEDSVDVIDLEIVALGDVTGTNYLCEIIDTTP